MPLTLVGTRAARIPALSDIRIGLNTGSDGEDTAVQLSPANPPFLDERTAEDRILLHYANAY
jgi:hypothetical protein